ncbi:MAG: hypothetical protein IKG94_03065 [Candidatus Methanomethylophilaceae archaeon]|nr:hypothetical protein [Candidatus Methanomethylophilaceae archaeon]
MYSKKTGQKGHSSVAIGGANHSKRSDEGASVFLIPCLGDITRMNYCDTVSNPKTPDYLEQNGASEMTVEALENTGRKKFGVWGFGSGKINTGKYKALSRGDFVVFVKGDRNGKYLDACGTVVCKEVNDLLSARIWKLDREHASFKNMFYMIECYEGLHASVSQEDLHNDPNANFQCCYRYDVKATTVTN